MAPPPLDDNGGGVVRRWALLTTLAAISAFAVKIGMAATTVGTDDVPGWHRFLTEFRESGGVGLYHRNSGFIHPAFMIHFLKLLDVVTTATSLRFGFWFRLPGILADLGSAILVWKIVQPRPGSMAHPAALVLFAAAPASIMISGFHGNTDPVMIFFLLLSVYLLDRREWTALSGVAFGMSLNIKVWPLIFVPAVFFYLPDLRKRLVYFGGATAAVVVGWLPYIAQDPVFITTQIAAYSSQPRWWGITRLTRKLPSELRWLKLFYDEYGKFVVLSVVVVASWWLNRPPKRPRLFVQCGLLSFLFMTLTPGFGVQYLAWLVPWVVGLGTTATVAYYTTSGMFLFSVYTYWSEGFPWNYARPRNWSFYSHIGLFELLCWASVVVILGIYVRLAGLSLRAR